MSVKPTKPTALQWVMPFPLLLAPYAVLKAFASSSETTAYDTPGFVGGLIGFGLWIWAMAGAPPSIRIAMGLLLALAAWPMLALMAPDLAVQTWTVPVVSIAMLGLSMTWAQEERERDRTGSRTAA